MGAGLILAGTLGAAALLGRYVAGATNAFHFGLPSSPEAVMGTLAVLAMGGLVLVNRTAALVLLVGAVYLNLSDVLVRLGAPSLLQILALPILFAAVTAKRREGLARLAGQPLTWLLAAYTLVLLASSTYARQPDLADARFAEAARGFVLYGLVVALVATPGRARVASWTMLASGALLGALGVYQDLSGDFDRTFGGLARWKQAQIYSDVFEPRIAGPLGDPNFFAQILVVLVPVGFFLAWSERRPGPRLVAFGLVAAVLAGTVLTYSRGGALALGIVVTLSLLAHGVDWRRIALGAAVAVAAAALLLPSGFAERLETIRQLLPGGTEEVLDLDSSFEERKLFAGAAWAMFLDHPVLGVGAGNYTTHYGAYAAEIGSAAPAYDDPGAQRYPHSLYLEVAAETGLAGLLMLVGVIAAAFLALWQARASFRSTGAGGMAGLARAYQIALVGYLVSSLFLHGAFQRYLWLLMAMAAALEFAAPRRARATGDAGEGPSAGAGGDGADVAVPAWSEREAPAGAPPVRRPVAVLLSRFPSVTETFILREVMEMERQGQPVLLVPLLREDPPVVHAEARPWVARALFTPLLSLPIAAANLRALLRHPLRYIGLLGRLLAGTWWRPRAFIATAGFVPKAVYLAQRLRAEGVRHVHAHFATHPATVALVAAAFAGASFSFTIHAHDLLSRQHRLLLGLKLRRARFVRLISAYNRDFLLRLYPETPPEKLHVIHVGIEPEAYAPADTPEESPSEEREPARLLTIAGFKPYKGLPVLLQAARRLRDEGFTYRWDIVGDGPQRPEIERGVRELGLEQHVQLLGAQPQDEVGRMLRARPLYVQPSVILSDGWMEGIPVALMEAMAAEAPVVASRLSGIPELVEDGVTGLLVEPGDAAGLAAAVRRVAEDPDLAGRLGRHGRRRVDAAFRLDSCVGALLVQIDRHNAPVEPREVAEAVAHLRPLLGRRPVGVRRVYAGADALVAELVVPHPEDGGGDVRSWVLKAHREVERAPRPASERARHEFAVLQTLGRALGSSTSRGNPLGVPEAVHLDAARAVVVMGACPGVRLDVLLRQARAARDEACWAAAAAALEQAGRGLRALQEATGPETDGDAARAAWKAEAEADLGRCHGLLPPPLAEALPARLDALERSAAPPTLRPVGHHGDFWPGNLLLGPAGLVAVDFEGYRPGLAYEDAAYFVLQLEGYFDYPFLRRRGAHLAEAFLRSYLGGPGRDGDGYRLMRATKALQMLARSGAAVRGAGGQRYSWRTRRHVRRLVRAIEEALQ